MASLAQSKERHANVWRDKEGIGLRAEIEN